MYMYNVHNSLFLTANSTNCEIETEKYDLYFELNESKTLLPNCFFYTSQNCYSALVETAIIRFKL
jgi:hypothetical protein